MPEIPDLIEKEFLFTENDFKYLTQLIHETTGISLKSDKQELVYGRLSRRLRELGLTTFNQYCDVLKKDDEDEAVHFINAITTNVTHFFRENHHFEYLKNTLIPELIRDKSSSYQPKLRIWSAGCSSGNEPYSIAMVLKECVTNIERWDAKILATDLDSNILDAAKLGVYPLASMKTVADARRKRWFKSGSGTHEGTVKVSKDLKDLISYKKLNLMDSWPMEGKFDFIFCRNVAIYFDTQTREKIIDRFADQLTDNGYLFVGHSETLFSVTSRFESVGKTIYRKVV